MPYTHRVTALLLLLACVATVYLGYRLGLTEKETLSGFITGISSGLLTALVLLAFRYVIRGGINPWIENLLYRDAHVEGVWIGAVVPYYGIEELDRHIRKAAFFAIQQLAKADGSDKSRQPKEETRAVEASIVENGERKKVDAELILPPKTQAGDTSIPERQAIVIDLSPNPIKIRVDLHRVGHKVHGAITELGGASDVHTYHFDGEFRNLIIAGIYENDSKSSLDRGSLSLMLVSNGQRLEGYFSVYSDHDHRIRPMKCILMKKSSVRESTGLEDKGELA